MAYTYNVQISLAVLCVLSPIITIPRTICANTLTARDIRTFQDLVLNNLTSALQKMTDDLLQPNGIAAIFDSSRRLEERAVSQSDVKSMLMEMTAKALSEYQTVRSALIGLRDDLNTFLNSPTPTLSGRPPLVQSCCEPRPPGQQLPINSKVGVPADTRDVCYSRNEATAGSGFDLWADKVMNTMKTNFETLPGVLWQEFALDKGLHVQFPAAKRSCANTGVSNSKLLRSRFRERVPKGSVNLVIVMDSSDKMTNKVFRPGSVLPPVSHWEIVKNAVTNTLATLMPDDKVSIVTTGGSSASFPLGCGESLFDVNDPNVQELVSFFEAVVPKGYPNYEESFQQAFDMLHHQQEKTSGSTSQFPATNVILFLTNGDNVITNEEKLFQTFMDGQASLQNKAHVQVYAVKQLYVATQSTWLKVADQNNQQLTVFDGRNNVTATAWKNVAGVQGPMGYMEIMEDIKGFKLADTVTLFYRRIHAMSTNHGQDVVSFTRDGQVQLITRLSNRPGNHSQDGIVSLNASLSHILDAVISFQFGRQSYAFVIDASTGLVILHPKIKKMKSTGVKLTLDTLEPDLTSSQQVSIKSSTKSGAIFSAKVSMGRELFLRGLSGPVSDAFIGHQLIEGTRFVVCVIVFKSDVKINTLSSQPMTASGNVVYHRFDLLPSAPPSCVLNGMISTQGDDIGIKFSHEVYTNHQAADREDTQKTAVGFDKFIHKQGSYPNILKRDSKDEIQNDLKVIQSKDLKSLWSKSRVEPLQRFLGTKTGVLAIQPAMPFVSSWDYQDYSWYGTAIMRPNLTIIQKETFPGQRQQLIVSKVIQQGQRIDGVVGASVPNHLMKALVFTEVPLCKRSESTCKFMDEKGNILDFWDSTTSQSAKHVTHEYPWLANKLLKLNIMSSSWSYSISSRTMCLQYLVQLPVTGVSSITSGPSTSECRKFALYPLHNTNLFILLLADRTVFGCPPENFNSGESCTTSSKVTSPFQGPSHLPFTPAALKSTPHGPPPPPFTPPALKSTPHGPPPAPFTPPALKSSPHGPPPAPFTPPPLKSTPHGPPPAPFTPPALKSTPHGPPPPPFTPPPLKSTPHGPPPPPFTPPPLKSTPHGPPPPPFTPPALKSTPHGPPPPPFTPPALKSTSHGPPPPPFTPPALKSTPHGPPPPPFTPPPLKSTSHGPPPPPFTPPALKSTPHGPPPPPFTPPALKSTPHGPPPPPFTPPALTPPPLHKSPLTPPPLPSNTIQTPPPLPHVSSSPSPSLSPSVSSLPKCTHCPGKNPPSLSTQCQVPCQCVVLMDSCTKTIKKESWGVSKQLNILNDNSGPSIHLVKPQKPVSSRPACPKRCTQISDKTECISNSRCEWSDENSVPICMSQLVNETSDTLEDSDDSSTPVVIGGVMGGVSLFVFLLVFLWRMSVRRKLCKQQRVSSSSDTLHDGKRFSKDGLIIQGQEVEKNIHPVSTNLPLSNFKDVINVQSAQN